MRDTQRQALRIVSQSMQSHGGRALLVGGAVRDKVWAEIQDREWEISDLDVEVFGLPGWELREIAGELGQVSVCGQSFEVIQLTMQIGGDGERVDVDLSLPRRDSKVGEGHRGFQVEGDPWMTIEDAAGRRDFTCNSMSWDPLTGELIDPFGGKHDIEMGLLRMVSRDHFGEDPLRVLRGMQFASRFGWKMDRDTVIECQSLFDEFPTLSRDRLWAEWKKWASGVRPSNGLRVLRKTWWVEWFPELERMVETEQDPVRHSEGNVFRHTQLVVDELARMGAGVEVMMAGLLHDIGKASTTSVGEDGHVHAFGHAQAGEELARRFLERIGAPKDVTEVVTRLVGAHMWHLNGASVRNVKRWSRRVSPASMGQLVQLVVADSRGRGWRGSGRNEELPWQVKELIGSVEAAGVQEEEEKPLLRGRDLLSLGMVEGPEVGEVLRESMEVQIEEGWTSREEAVEWAEARLG